MPAARGLEVSQLQVREMDGGQYVVRRGARTGPTRRRRCWPKLCPAGSPLCASTKPCAGMPAGVAFSRPIRWLLALLGGQVVPFEYAGLASGRVTRGLRFHEPETFELHSAAGLLRCAAIAGHPARPAGAPRRHRRAGQAHPGRERRRWARWTTACWTRSTNLVEAPTALRGQL